MAAPGPGKSPSTSNSAPLPRGPASSGKQPSPFPRPQSLSRLSGLPVARLYACLELLPGCSEFSSLSLRQITRPRASRRREPCEPTSFPVGGGALPAPPLRLQRRENSEARTRALSPGGRGGGGAQARSVRRWAPGQPASCLLPPRARGSPRANGGQPRPRRPRVPLAPRHPRQQPRSGSLGRLGLVRGKVRARAVALPCSGSIPSLPRQPEPSSPPGGGSVTGAAAVSRVYPRARAGQPAGGDLRAFSAGDTGLLNRGKLARGSWGPPRAPPAGLAIRLGLWDPAPGPYRPSAQRNSLRGCGPGRVGSDLGRVERIWYLTSSNLVCLRMYANSTLIRFVVKPQRHDNADCIMQEN